MYSAPIRALSKATMVSVRLRVPRAALLLVSCLPPRMALDDAAALAEQHELRLRLDALESQLNGDEQQYAYVIVKGYIEDAGNLYQETMDVDEAKAYCNSNAECKGFTFLGPEEHPEDEVTVTFKDGSRIVHDPSWVSFVKESSMFGGLHGAMSLGEAQNPAIISHSLTSSYICFGLALLLFVAFVCRSRAGAAKLKGEAHGERLLPR